ncbi:MULTISPECIES: hypothetical protein [Halobacteriovorax]|uniref:Uncharacterized protein n=1 Tax=Halobacteriovorax vibrionivorans TaxID=2152716 RepID=A0ABY0IET8_9BACT|nr:MULTISPECIES: hypothetical protein [Halobacteriovorax]AYF45041.1 hypothetical protein BALOs_2042 [Halobacteriovorax sp. BALOs_7]RZF21105.1 hypothetical protein DAY19_14085 [Halobacteriovorax vibrionivorans]TGD47009.1 hypothetical protein EP118_09570 [Halobacteriovorax sp. Y22]
MSDKSLFKEIDIAIDKQIEEARSSNFFQSTADQLRAFSETEQRIINQFFSAVTLIIPILLLAGVFIFRTIQKNELTTRLELKDSIISFKEGNVQLKTQEGGIISDAKIYEKPDFVQMLSNSLTRFDIESNQVSVDGFSRSNLGGSISRIETNLMINKFTNKALVGLLNELHRRFKVIITEVELERTKDTKFVSGKFTFEFYTKAD